MTLRFLGKKSLAATIPILAELAATFDIPGLVGQIYVLGQLVLTFTPPSLAGIITLTGAIAAAANANFQPPTVDLKLDLQVKLDLLKIKLKLLLKITDLLLAAGVHLYGYDGKASSMGAALTSEFAPGPSQGGIVASENVYAIVLVVEASSGATVTSVKTVFGDS